MRAAKLLAALLACLPLPALAVSDADRTPVYREFRALFDAQRYEEALPLAERLVALTEEQYGAEDPKLVAPLINLATTRQRLRDLAAAEQAYLRSLQILDAQGKPSNRELIRPLHGLGLTYLEMGQPEAAVVPLERAVDLSRSLDGLFNEGQLPALDRLIDAYVLLGRLQDAELQHQYAFRVAESAYGKSDLRLLGPLDRFARWFESVGRHATARALHARAIGIVDSIEGPDSLRAVGPLRGVARTYRMEYLYGAETLETAPAPAPIEGTISGPDYNLSQGRLNLDGERALQLALQLIERREPVDRARRGETLIDLGDWYMAGGAANRAIEFYEKAWQDLEAVGEADRLAHPEPIMYRPPANSVMRTRLDPEEYELREVEAQFTVERDGRTSDIKILPGEAPEATQRSVLSAVRRARYRPRIADGKAVATSQVALRERMAVKIDKPRES